MDKLLIKYRFQGFPYIVADGKGEFYQLPHTANKYTRSFRKLNLILNNGITAGYRINRKFVSFNQLRKVAYISNEVVATKIDLPNPPF
ncbi:MAG: hypothetical protein COB15_03040 [Flavobacteriales bacterium]|nr:MAG: hypothetical protein COB15_03040 [Flavobacteriales bacterium]